MQLLITINKKDTNNILNIFNSCSNDLIMNQNRTLTTITWTDSVLHTLCGLPEHPKAGQLCISWMKYALGPHGWVSCPILQIGPGKARRCLWPGCVCLKGPTKHCPQSLNTVHAWGYCRPFQSVDMLLI